MSAHGPDSDGEREHDSPSPPKSDMSMMRIAVAGTGGLARLIAYYIDEDTSHHVVFLSRQSQPQLTAEGYQVSVVDYSNADSLKYALRGIDTVISTVTGVNQIELIKAAVAARVRRFAPAEFEGPPSCRGQNDPLDRSRFVARSWLQYYSQHIQSTVFVCGILYERFQPGGLQRTRMGFTSGFSGEGNYMMDCRNMSAEVPAYDVDGSSNVTVCLTAAQDVARFVTRSVDLRQWPPELRMCGQKMPVKDLVILVQRLNGRQFNPLLWHSPATLQSELSTALNRQDNLRAIRLQTLIATAEGHYDYSSANLHRLFPDVRPISFQEWFVAKWNLQH